MEDRINVFLDLDNTIINGLEEEEREKLPLAFQNQFDHHDLSAYGMRIFGRPHLQEFLDFLMENFNVNVFTAAEPEYAMFIVNNFILNKPGRKINYAFFRYHVDIALKRYDGMKDLRLLWNVFALPNVHPCNTLLVDDLDDVYDANPDNTIRVRSFDVATRDGIMVSDAANDNELLRVMNVLKEVKKRYDKSGCARQIYLNQAPDSTPLLLM